MMEQQLLIADGDGSLTDLYQKYFAAHGYSVRVALGGVECVTALRETPPDVLVLDTELKWGGADGVLTVMEEENGLSNVPIVLLNDRDRKTNGDDVPLAWPSSPAEEATRLEWATPALPPSMPASVNTLPLGAQVVDRLLKPFYFQNLLASIGTATTRPMPPR